MPLPPVAPLLPVAPLPPVVPLPPTAPPLPLPVRLPLPPVPAPPDPVPEERGGVVLLPGCVRLERELPDERDERELLERLRFLAIIFSVSPDAKASGY